MMALLVLKILLVLIVLQGLAKFLVWGLVKKEKRMKMAEAMYAKKGGEASVSRISDGITFIFLVILIGLLAMSGIDYINFTTGFVVGLSVLQLYLHAFNEPLSTQPPPPLSPVKLFSFAIKEMPQKAWLEVIFMTVVFVWFLYMLAAELVQRRF